MASLLEPERPQLQWWYNAEALAQLQCTEATGMDLYTRRQHLGYWGWDWNCVFGCWHLLADLMSLCWCKCLAVNVSLMDGDA